MRWVVGWVVGVSVPGGLLGVKLRFVVVVGAADAGSEVQSGKSLSEGESESVEFK